ncbi:MAG: hypothetical protein HEEMFOPI_01412 [Holosporales bacterium]
MLGEGQQAKNFLYMLCYLDPDKIYVDLFKEREQISFHEFGSELLEIGDVVSLIENLEALSLIKYDRLENTISLHRLFQLVGRKKIEENKDILYTLSKYFRGFLKTIHKEDELKQYQMILNVRQHLSNIKQLGIDKSFIYIEDEQYSILRTLLKTKHYLDHNALIQECLEWSIEDYNSFMEVLKLNYCYFENPYLMFETCLWAVKNQNLWEEEWELTKKPNCEENLDILNSLKEIMGYRQLCDEEKFNCLVALGFIPPKERSLCIKHCNEFFKFELSFFRGFFMLFYFVSKDDEKSALFADFLTKNKKMFIEKNEFQLEKINVTSNCCQIWRNIISPLKISIEEYINTKNIFSILLCIMNIKLSELNDIINHSKQFVKEGMTAFDIFYILSIVSNIDLLDRKEIISCSHGLVKDSMDLNDITYILLALDGIKSSEREDVVERSKFLIRDNMGGNEISSILKGVHEISHLEREDIIRRAKPLIRDNMGGYDISAILEGIYKIPRLEREDVIRGLQREAPRKVRFKARIKARKML